MPNANSFVCATSLAGTCLKDINLSLVLHREENKIELMAMEKATIKGDSLLIYVFTSQLTKVIAITIAAVKAYVGLHALLSM